MYIDDMIIFLILLDNHVKYLDQVLELLEKSEIILSLSKYYFVYPSITALEHYILRLRLSIIKEKVDVVRKIQFPKNLRELKTELGFFGYYRKFIKNYITIARLLIRLKIKGFKRNLKKGKPRQKYTERK